MKFVKAHWKQLATLIASLAVGLALHLGKLSPDQATAIGAVLALVGIHLAPITYGKPPAPPASLGMHVLALACLGALSTGCLAATPQVPVTPANAQQIKSCSNTAAWHNGFIVGDFTVGGLGGAAGVAGSLLTDQGQKTAMAVTAGVAGALTAAGAAVAGYTANKYVGDGCPTYTGPLPLGKTKAAGGLR